MYSQEQVRAALKAFETTARNNWPLLADEMGGDLLNGVDAEATSLSAFYAEISGFAAGGVKHAERRRKAVRKALGYTYP